MSDQEDDAADDQLQDPARGDMPVRDADFARQREQQPDGSEGDQSDAGEEQDEPGPKQGEDPPRDEGADEEAGEDRADGDEDKAEDH